MKKLITVLALIMSISINAQQTATDSTLKDLPMERMRQETQILDNNICYQILMREENILLRYKPTKMEKNTPSKRILKALQVQFYLSKCSKKDKDDYKSFIQVRY